MEAAIFYVCFVLFVVCALASFWLLHSGDNVCESGDKLLVCVEYWVIRMLFLVASVSIIGIGYSWPGGV